MFYVSQTRDTWYFQCLHHELHLQSCWESPFSFSPFHLRKSYCQICNETQMLHDKPPKQKFGNSINILKCIFFSSSNNSIFIFKEYCTPKIFFHNFYGSIVPHLIWEKKKKQYFIINQLLHSFDLHFKVFFIRHNFDDIFVLNHKTHNFVALLEFNCEKHFI